MVSVCLPSDALLQHLPSYLGFSYLGHGVSLHGCSSKVQLLLLTLDEGYLLIAALPDLQHGIAPLGPPEPTQPPLLGCGVAPPGRCPGLGCGVAPPGRCPGLGCGVAPPGRCPGLRRCPYLLSNFCSLCSTDTISALSASSCDGRRAFLSLLAILWNSAFRG